jgi:outer membrane protein assembly factor BamB
MHSAYRLAALVLSVVIAVLATGGVLAAPASPGHGYWPMFMDGPAHNGNNRDETTLSPSTVGGLRNTQSYTSWLGLLGMEGISPVVMGNIGASLTDSGGNRVRLSVFNLPSGGLRWSHLLFRGDPRPAIPVPVLSNGDIFVGLNDTVYAYDAMTGLPLWKRVETSRFNETSVAKGIVYVSTYGSPTMVYALSAATGAMLWSAMLTGENYGLSAVSVANGVAFVNATKLWALNATSGAFLFKSTVDTNGGTAAVSNGVAYVENVDTLQAFNASTGGRLWSTTTAAGDFFSSLEPAVDGSTVIITMPRYVIAFDASSGARLWTHDAGSMVDYFPPAIANGVVYVTSPFDGLEAFSEATGALLYSNTGIFPAGSPIVSQGAVYVGCSNGMQVFAL